MSLWSSGQVTDKSERRTSVWGDGRFYAYVSTCTNLCTCVATKGGQGVLSYFFHSLPYFFQTGSLTESRANRFPARLSVQQAPVIFLCLPWSPNSGVKGVCSHTWGFMCMPGPKLRSSCLTTKCSYPLSIFTRRREESPYSQSEGSHWVFKMLRKIREREPQKAGHNGGNVKGEVSWGRKPSRKIFVPGC